VNDGIGAVGGVEKAGEKVTADGSDRTGGGAEDGSGRAGGAAENGDASRSVTPESGRLREDS
jgi:hypothetical protein